MPRVICVIIQNRIEMAAVFLHYVFSFMIMAKVFLLFQKTNHRFFFLSLCNIRSFKAPLEQLDCSTGLPFNVHVYSVQQHFRIRIQAIMHINLHIFSALMFSVCRFFFFIRQPTKKWQPFSKLTQCPCASVFYSSVVGAGT